MSSTRASVFSDGVPDAVAFAPQFLSASSFYLSNNKAAREEPLSPPEPHFSPPFSWAVSGLLNWRFQGSIEGVARVAKQTDPTRMFLLPAAADHELRAAFQLPQTPQESSLRPGLKPPVTFACWGPTQPVVDFIAFPLAFGHPVNLDKDTPSSASSAVMPFLRVRLPIRPLVVRLLFFRRGTEARKAVFRLAIAAMSAVYVISFADLAAFVATVGTSSSSPCSFPTACRVPPTQPDGFLTWSSPSGASETFSTSATEEADQQPQPSAFLVSDSGNNRLVLAAVSSEGARAESPRFLQSWSADPSRPLRGPKDICVLPPGASNFVAAVSCVGSREVAVIDLSASLSQGSAVILHRISSSQGGRHFVSPGAIRPIHHRHPDDRTFGSGSEAEGEEFGGSGGTAHEVLVCDSGTRQLLIVDCIVGEMVRALPLTAAKGSSTERLPPQAGPIQIPAKSGFAQQTNGDRLLNYCQFSPSDALFLPQAAFESCAMWYPHERTIRGRPNAPRTTAPPPPRLLVLLRRPQNHDSGGGGHAAFAALR